MEQRLSLITLAVEDVERATAFYRDGLGWVPGVETDGVAFFQLNGIVLSLFRRDLFAHDLGSGREAPGPGATALAYNVRAKAEVGEIMDRVREAGGRVVVEPRDTDWGGHAGYFADPDGHLWEVAWNPAWPIDDQGNVRLEA